MWVPCKTVSVSSLLLDVNHMQIYSSGGIFDWGPTFIRSLYQWHLHFPLVPGLPTTPLYTSLLPPHLLLSDILAILAFRGKLLITNSSTRLPGSEHQVYMCEVIVIIWKAVLISTSSNFQVPQAQSPTRFIKALFTLDKVRVLSNRSTTFHRLQALVHLCAWLTLELSAWAHPQLTQSSSSELESAICWEIWQPLI